MYNNLIVEKIAIIGTGGFAREVLCLIQDINRQKTSYEILGFIDNVDQHVHGYPVVGNDKEINATKTPIAVVLAVGDPKMKERIVRQYDNPLISFPTLIHPSVIMGENVKIGKGCIICAGCILTTDLVVKDFVTLNLSCTVGHDSVIGDYCSMMPSVNVSGEVNMNDSVYVGTGSKIINQVDIGEGTVIGAGAVVTKTLPANCTAVGVPAKVIKYHDGTDKIQKINNLMGGGNTLIIKHTLLHITRIAA